MKKLNEIVSTPSKSSKETTSASKANKDLVLTAKPVIRIGENGVDTYEKFIGKV